MKRTHFQSLATIVLLVGAQQAFADGTTANTTISNTATVNYTVGTVGQTAEADTVEFLVDRRINLDVAEVGGANTSVSPGATSQVLTYTVTNTSNDVMDFSLAAANGAGADAPVAGTDNFDPIGTAVFVESDATPGYQAAEDTATYIDELAVADGNPGVGIVTVYVIADIPVGQADGSLAAITLTATAADGGVTGTQGADATEDNAADSSTTVQNVFGDATAGDTDAVQDGKDSDTDAYEVASATIAVTKTSTVISDPFNGTSNPKAIPGATVEYCILIANSGGSAATAVAVSDAVPANTTYVASSITVADDCAGTSGAPEDDDTAGADETDGVSGSSDGTTVQTEVSSLAANTDTATIFQVTID